jgi:F-type H+-transporting ATPase subunit b
MELVTPEFGLLFWQVLTFAVVLFILSRFAWKPILTGLREREESIESALSEARKAKEEMAGLKADNERLLAEARKERDKMMQEAQSAAANLLHEAREKSGKEAQAMVDSARAEIEISKEAALAELKNYLAATSLEIAGKIVRKNLADDASQQKLVEQLISSPNSLN